MSGHPAKVNGRKEIAPELLRQLVRYESDTGEFFWLPRAAEMFSCQRSSKTWLTESEPVGLPMPALATPIMEGEGK